MLIVIRANAWELIDCPQSIQAAWDLADKLTAETGILHTVGRI